MFELTVFCDSKMEAVDYLTKNATQNAKNTL